MTDRKTETIDIGRGIQYAKVAARLSEFHRDNDECVIETSYEFKEGYVIFSAKVTNNKGVFTGHSLAKVAGQLKQFEKQETIAVGRALAFAGYLSSGDIACQEEIEDIVTKAQLDSLKLKWHKAHGPGLEGQSRGEKQESFAKWARETVGQEFDPLESREWEKQWFDSCWRVLIGPDADVPFE